jgi:predicted transcriptional regulator
MSLRRWWGEAVTIDDDATRLLNRLLASDVKLSILELFHTNPELADSLDGVALRIDRSPSEIEKDVNDFLDIGLLERKTVGNSEVICFDAKRDMAIQEIISNHVKRSGD